VGHSPNRLCQPIMHSSLVVVTNMNLPTFTVLIVEDLLENRQCLLSDSSCAYDLIEAGSVAKGLELYSTNTIDAMSKQMKLLTAWKRFLSSANGY
jgi:hypothetical protein